MDTVSGDSGVLAVSHVAVDRVTGHARATIHHPSTEAKTALDWDRVLNRKIATVKTAALVKTVNMLSVFSVLVIAKVKF